MAVKHDVAGENILGKIGNGLAWAERLSLKCPAFAADNYDVPTL
jgi:hypothetical protein